MISAGDRITFETAGTPNASLAVTASPAALIHDDVERAGLLRLVPHSANRSSVLPVRVARITRPPSRST